MVFGTAVAFAGLLLLFYAQLASSLIQGETAAKMQHTLCLKARSALFARFEEGVLIAGP
jgi:hypothetical protein